MSLWLQRLIHLLLHHGVMAGRIVQ
jgi:hypothetical protein